MRSAPFAAGCVLAGSAGAGELFPQPTAGEASAPLRMDERLGDAACLIARTPGGGAVAGVRRLDLGAEDLAPFRPALLAWLDQRQAEAVLVRPDRYVFGAGAPGRLLEAWDRCLKPPVVAASAGARGG